MPLVETREEIVTNIKTLEDYLVQGTEEEREFAKGLVGRGLNLIVYKVNEKLHFAPSRFCGYNENSLSQYNQDHGDGKLTSPKIAEIFDSVWGKDVALAERHREYCRELETEASNASKRKFIYIDEDVEFLFEDSISKEERGSRKSKEAEFGELLKSLLQTNFPDYSVSTKENVLYKVSVSKDGEYVPNSPVNDVKRGKRAFETDLVIKDSSGVPLVIFELKYGGYQTHDVITYSSKAGSHKTIFPHLRYGFVVGGIDRLNGRFFSHNANFDFGMALDESDDDALPKFVSLAKRQVEYSRKLNEIFNDSRVSAKTYETQLILD